MRIEYEYIHRDPDNPNSPRWEPAGWNSDDNPESFGYASTGETRTVIITPGIDAVYETVTIPAVTEEREHITVACPPTGESDSTGGTEDDLEVPDDSQEPESDEQDSGQEPVGSGDGVGHGNGTGTETPLTTPAPVMAPVSGTTDQSGTGGSGSINDQAQNGAAGAPALTAEVGALAYTASVNAAPAAVAEASAFGGTSVPAELATTEEQLAYTGTSTGSGSSWPEHSWPAASAWPQPTAS